MAKLQTAFEMMVVYGWALLLVSVIISVLLFLAFSRSPAQYIGSSCNIQPAFPCPQTAMFSYNSVAENRFVLQFTNNLGSPILFSTNGVTLLEGGVGSQTTGSYTGSCRPSLALVGSPVTCLVNIPGTYLSNLGTGISDEFTLNYGICTTKSPASCSGDYLTSGFSTQPLSGPNQRLYTLNLLANGKGNIFLGGVEYVTPGSLYLLPGAYVISAAPSPSNSFSHWSLSGYGSPTNIISAGSVNTTLNIGSGATLTANFN